MNNSVPFDPGFAPLVSNTVAYLYSFERELASISAFQRRSRLFSVSAPKILKCIINNVAFFNGCLAWAYYISVAFPDSLISGNNFLNVDDSQINDYVPTEHPDFLIQYLKKFTSDLKYYNVKNISAPDNFPNILNSYREFVVLNDGFIHTSSTNLLKFPDNLSFSVPVDKIKDLIDSAISTRNLSILLTI